MANKLYPKDFEIIDKDIALKVALKKYSEQHFLMANLKDGVDDDKVGDVIFVGTEDEVRDTIYRLAEYSEISNFPGLERYSNYAGEAIILRSLGLNSLR